jgi:xanthine dehydrogenase accessory factor
MTPEIVDALRRASEEGTEAALATVVSTHDSAPCDPGACMVILGDGRVFGSVSGGCVEGAVVEEATKVLQDGRPKLLSYGIADELAATVGLTCGGTIRVWVERMDRSADVRRIAAALDEQRPLAVVTQLTGAGAGDWVYAEPGRVDGRLRSARLTERVTQDALGMLAVGATGVRHYGPDGEARQDEVEVFVRSLVRPPRMYVFGATDFASATVSIGKLLGCRVTVCDARSRFLTATRFPEADELIARWPDEFLAEAPVDERTAIVVLTHDPKFDVPLLLAALRTPAGYIGAMGSRRTCDDRTRRLLEEGVDPVEIGRVRAPIGLDIGARTPAEVAVAIAGELIALRYGRPAGFLNFRAGAVHLPPQVVA